MAPARRLVCLALVPALAGGCFRGCERRTTAAVDVPLRLEKLEERHHPPDVIVSVVRQEEHLDGPHCGHSAACIVLLPMIPILLLAQDKWDEVTVTDRGKVVLQAIYASSGELRSAVLFEGAVQRRIVHLKLDWLRRGAIVERSRLEMLPDGTPRERVTPILTQVDLLAEYAAALKDGSDLRRGGLLAEAFKLLPGESDAFVLEQLSADRSSEAARRAAVVDLCRDPQPDPDRAAAFVDASLVPPAATVAFDALACKQLTGAVADLVARTAGPHFCTTREAPELEAGAEGLSRAPKGAMGEALRQCPPERRALARLFRGEYAPDADIAKAMASPELRKIASRKLEATDPLHRRWILQGLGSGSPDDLLDRLQDRDVPHVGPGELAQLLAAAPANPVEEKEFARYAKVLQIAAAPPENREMDRALSALARTELGSRATMALAARGHPGARRETARALVPNQHVPVGVYWGIDSIRNRQELAGYALVLGGCRRELLEAHLGRATDGALEAAECAGPASR